jgi:hypothetical protein
MYVKIHQSCFMPFAALFPLSSFQIDYLIIDSIPNANSGVTSHCAPDGWNCSFEPNQPLVLGKKHR